MKELAGKGREGESIHKMQTGSKKDEKAADYGIQRSVLALVRQKDGRRVDPFGEGGGILQLANYGLKDWGGGQGKRTLLSGEVRSPCRKPIQKKKTDSITATRPI